jgi:hypothetical protein
LLSLIVAANLTSGVNDTGGHIFSEIYFDRGVSGGKLFAGVNDAGG